MDGASLPQCHRLTLLSARKREFCYDDGCRTAASSEASSLTFVAAAAGPDLADRLRKAALATCPKMSAAMGEGKKKEDKNKEGKDVEHMEEDIELEHSQDKDATSGEDKGGGSGTAA